MSAIEQLRAELGPVRIFHAEPYPFPVCLLKNRSRLREAFVRGGSRVWATPTHMEADIAARGAVVLEICDNGGFVFVYERNGRAAKISASFDGNKRAFIKKYGPSRDAKRAVLDYVFEKLGVKILQLEIPADSRGAQRTAASAGFLPRSVVYEMR